MAGITLNEILSKGNSMTQEQFALYQNYIVQNTSSIASANALNISYSTINIGDLTRGAYYEILDNSGGADFTSVGAADNNVGTQFKANLTNLTPTWGAGSLAKADWNGATATITGTTTINTISKKFLNSGQKIRLIFSGALQLTDSAGTSGDDCELVLGSNLTTAAGDEVELQLRSDNKFYVVANTIEGIVGGGLWKSDSGFTQLITAEQIRLSKMIQQGQAASIASANNLTFPAGGNTVALTNSANDIELISNLDSDGIQIQGGTKYTLILKSGQLIKNEQSASGNFKSIILKNRQAYDALSDNDTLTLVYDSVSDSWIEIGLSEKTIGDTVEYRYNSINDAKLGDGYLFNAAINQSNKKFIRVRGEGALTYELTKLNFYYIDDLSEEVTDPEITIRKNTTNVSDANTVIAPGDNDLLANITAGTTFADGDYINPFVDVGTGTSSGSAIDGYFEYELKVVS